MTDQPTFFMRETPQPLAARLRPQTLDQIVGQRKLLGEGKILRRIVEQDAVSSMIFWGPPGVGKTTLANVIARQTRSKFIDFSAVTSGIKEIREVMREADANRAYGTRTIVFVDEIHRFNKAQQDAFLPFVEKGAIVLIGATTENPSFEVNGALLSRCKVFVLEALTEDDIVELLTRALTSPQGFGNQRVTVSEDLLRSIAVFSNGDARSALSTLEMAVLNSEPDAEGAITVERETIEQCVSRKSLLYDKNGEEHYNLISALHKSMRNSDADASIYWLARMLEAGEDPLYVARRIIRFASEDVGMTDPRALQLAVSVYQACHYIGMPECSVHLTEAVVYMALAPKSNSLYMAYNTAREDALNQLSEPVPLHIRNGVTNLMRDVGYGQGYRYAHDFDEKLTDMRCLPDSLLDRQYYCPTSEGFEKNYGDRYRQIKEWKASQGRAQEEDGASERLDRRQETSKTRDQDQKNQRHDNE
ncbi:MAG: replication-associated recombination protein A [Thermoguttaceae bacterium]|nr:replication-associated recombination protein A [Thermoguttaceae bacterium]